MEMTALDYEQIKQLHARYCHSVDFEDVNGLLACFAPDGSFESADEPDSSHQGEEGLRRFGAEVAEGTAGHVRHSVLSSLIDGDGSTARSLSYAVITRDFGPPAGKGQAVHSAVLTTGLYDDDLVKADGRWVYAKRTFYHDGWPAVLKRLRKPVGIAHVDAGAVQPGGLSALDYEAIRQLLARYAYTLDFEDYDGFVGCFTPDGSFSAVTRPDMGGSGKTQGREQLRQFVLTVGGWVRGHARHGAISAVIEGDGERAYVSSYAFIPMDYGTPRQPRQRDNATVGTTGVYRDEVVKVDGRWLFAQRTYRYDGWPDILDLCGKPLGVELFAS